MYCLNLGSKRNFGDNAGRYGICNIWSIVDGILIICHLKTKARNKVIFQTDKICVSLKLVSVTTCRLHPAWLATQVMYKTIKWRFLYFLRSRHLSLSCVRIVQRLLPCIRRNDLHSTYIVVKLWHIAFMVCSSILFI